MVDPVSFKQSGALHIPGLVRGTLAQWIAATHASFARNRPGHRIADCAALGKLAQNLLEQRVLSNVVEGPWRCVRAIAFNKSPEANWALGWHQDRTIAAKRRAAIAGYTVWSKKDGIEHVEPPFALLARMITMRIHLDPVDEHNGPLLVALGTHAQGRIAEADIDDCVARSEVQTCTALAGDAWLYATPVLHASARSSSSAQRRVLHLDFSRDSLPEPLEWAGIG